MGNLVAAGAVSVGLALSGFAQLGELSFTRADNSPVSQAISTQFVAEMAPSVGQKFEWARTDIDGDGYDELFIHLLAPAVCAANGCPIIGYHRVTDGSWRPILTVVGSKIAVSLTPGGALEIVVDPGEMPSPRYVFDKAVNAMVPFQPASQN